MDVAVTFLKIVSRKKVRKWEEIPQPRSRRKVAIRIEMAVVFSEFNTKTLTRSCQSNRTFN